jgi:hypothetical protein
LQKGKIRGRSAARNKQLIDSAGIKDFWTAWWPLLILSAFLFVLGIVAWALKLN